jgi:hypothetical protein
VKRSPQLETARRAMVGKDNLAVELSDGRTIKVRWLGSPGRCTGRAQRSNWRLIGSGEGISWPDLDEDISVASLLAGPPSSETGESLRRWLDARPAKKRRATIRK